MISVDDLIRDLDANPVWAMSLGSKELFHSNLLAWFMDHQPEVRDAIVQAWTKPEPEATTTTAQAPKVLTEYKHLDLVVYTPGRQVLVIENKVFALPDERQLDAYSANTIPGMPGSPALVLLSLTDPGWPDGSWTAPTGQRWWWRSYDDLQALLAPLVPAVSRDDLYVGETLGRWLHLLESLQHRLAALGSPADHEPLPLNATDSKLLATARLNTPVQKMRFAHLVRQVRMQLPEQTPPLTLLAGLTHTVGLAEGFARDRDPEFGWQMQGNKFKLCVSFRSGSGYGTGKDAVAARCERARQYLEFFNFDHVRRLTGKAEGEMPIGSDSFDHYSPGFCYRYMPVGSITVEDAVSLAVHYSKHVAEYALQHSERGV
jgi:PD-(D/E)XK nuclease superfamily